jgi:Chlorophyll A-B binding protein
MLWASAPLQHVVCFGCIGAKPRVWLLTAVPLRCAEEGLWLPNTERPAWLDGSLPGDRGFDPLGLSRPTEYLQVRPPLLPCHRHSHLHTAPCCLDHPQHHAASWQSVISATGVWVLVSVCAVYPLHVVHLPADQRDALVRRAIDSSHCAHRSTSTSWTRTRQSTRPAASSASSARCRTMCPPTACSHTQRCAAAWPNYRAGHRTTVCTLSSDTLLHSRPPVFPARAHAFIHPCAGVRPEPLPRDRADPRAVGHAGDAGRGGGGGDDGRRVAGRRQGGAGRRLLPGPLPPLHRHVRPPLQRPRSLPPFCGLCLPPVCGFCLTMRVA